MSVDLHLRREIEWMHERRRERDRQRGVIQERRAKRCVGRGTLRREEGQWLKERDEQDGRGEMRDGGDKS